MIYPEKLTVAWARAKERTLPHSTMFSGMRHMTHAHLSRETNARLPFHFLYCTRYAAQLSMRTCPHMRQLGSCFCIGIESRLVLHVDLRPHRGSHQRLHLAPDGYRLGPQRVHDKALPRLDLALKLPYLVLVLRHTGGGRVSLSGICPDSACKDGERREAAEVLVM